MQGIRGVLFDGGNTLFYFDGSWPDVFGRADKELLTALQAGGWQINEGLFLAEMKVRREAYYEQREDDLIEPTTRTLVAELIEDLGFPALPEQVLARALARMYAVSQTHWLPEEDAVSTLSTLRQRGYRLGMVSNAADDADVQLLVEKANLLPYLDFVLTSAACGIRKPDPRIFHRAIQNWPFAKAEIVMVGDTLLVDISGAINAGLSSIWITRRAEESVPIREDSPQPDASVSTLVDLLDLLP